MKHWLWFLSTGIAVAGAAVVADSGKPSRAGEAKDVTLVGELVDAACFVVTDGISSGPDHAECGSACLASGLLAGLLPHGDDPAGMLFLLTNPEPLSGRVGQTVKVEGRVYQHLHAVDVQRLYVRNGRQWREVVLRDERHKPRTGNDGVDQKPESPQRERRR
jgi:hypothetical protein